MRRTWLSPYLDQITPKLCDLVGIAQYDVDIDVIFIEAKTLEGAEEGEYFIEVTGLEFHTLGWFRSSV